MHSIDAKNQARAVLTLKAQKFFTDLRTIEYFKLFALRFISRMSRLLRERIVGAEIVFTEQIVHQAAAFAAKRMGIVFDLLTALRTAMVTHH